jgi:hypothetical protein
VALPTTVASAAPVAAKAATGLPMITVTMNGKKITVSGALQSGGVQIVSRVSHEPQGSPVLVRLDPGVTVAQFLAALPKIGADQNNIDGIGSIVFSPQADKGTSSAQADLAAGQYVALDVAPNAKIPPLHPVYDHHGRFPGEAAQAAGHYCLDRVRLPRPWQAA